MDRVSHAERKKAEEELRYYAQHRDSPAETEPAVLNKHPDQGAADEQRYAENAQPPLSSDEVEKAIPNPPNANATTAYEEPNYRPTTFAPTNEVPGSAISQNAVQLQGTHTGPGISKQEAEATGADAGIKRSLSQRDNLGNLKPHLQFVCGPMLKYDTVFDSVWYGAAMIVTADEGSTYDPTPILGYSWNGGQKSVNGQPIYVYRGPSGTFTFWRFMIDVPLGESENAVEYGINGGARYAFHVPAHSQHLRWIGQSCNGFSMGVNPADFNGPFRLWDDVLRQHKEKPFHTVVGGGDQIYCDILMREPELQDWVSMEDGEEKQKMPLTEPIAFALDRFFFNHYSKWFRAGSFGEAVAKIPQVNILDDHDLIDGFGSYPDELMYSPIFNKIGTSGYFWYLLFQQFTVMEVDGSRITSPQGFGEITSAQVRARQKAEENKVPAPKPHTFKSMIIGGEGVYIPFPTHNTLTYLGPKVYMLGLDCRAERKLDQMCSRTTWDLCFEAIKRLPEQVEQLVWLIGVPLLYPRMVFAEKFLEWKGNPLTFIGRHPWLGLNGFVNKFNKDAELLDDLNDHWCAKHHKKERNWFIEQCQKLALDKNLRISFLSGDVHAAAVGRTYSKKKEPTKDHKLMFNVVTSAIVNTPPPPVAAKVVNYLATKKHKSLHYIKTEEDAVKLFQVDTNGEESDYPYVMPRRNWTSIEFDESTGNLVYDIRVEIEKGSGTTKGYVINSPPPRYNE
ncbi:hypothetical protein E3P81_01381 [Wallemia ichthyophaga]|nr:hypothetical protein E3P97_01382 [Wallemia ichthyophaga]TIA98961.1 hypothetical protein E3P96_03040 [Wallemia ichthyophaga]TIB48310.1 hypothetical protein E3P82_01380 [Wallemia ichthyophaga]TIB52460.1 hypothetical protein E3P81_01381 [Wallemia ichthyophaga]TIB55130.1 hypothetical protein E3P80_01381 [Wallemia ichthyophaga]